MEALVSSEAESPSDTERSWQEVESPRELADHMVWASSSSDSEPMPEDMDEMPFLDKNEGLTACSDPKHLFWSNNGVPCTLDLQTDPAGLLTQAFGKSFGHLLMPPNPRAASTGQKTASVSRSKSGSNGLQAPSDGLTSGGEADLDIGTQESDTHDTGDTSGEELRDTVPRDLNWKRRLANQVARSRRDQRSERTVLHTVWDTGFSTDENAETCATAEDEDDEVDLDDYTVGHGEVLQPGTNILHL